MREPSAVFCAVVIPQPAAIDKQAWWAAVGGRYRFSSLTTLPSITVPMQWVVYSNGSPS